MGRKRRAPTKAQQNTAGQDELRPEGQGDVAMTEAMQEDAPGTSEASDGANDNDSTTEATSGDDDDESEEEFEDQGSESDSEEEDPEEAEEDDPEDAENLPRFRFDESTRPAFRPTGVARAREIAAEAATGKLRERSHIHADDLSSDDEDDDGLNTIGRIPLHWYDEFDHIGYDVKGRRVARGGDGKDALDAAIEGADDPDVKARTIRDAYNGRNVVLSQRDMEIIRRVAGGAVAHPESNQYPDYVAYYTGTDIMQTSMNAQITVPKRRFLPSKWELLRVNRIVRGIQEGRIRPEPRPTPEQMEAERERKMRECRGIWDGDEGEDEETRRTARGLPRIPAPKMPLPGHAASYNPPEEYLFSPEEEQAWHEADPKERELDFLPKKFGSLREVGAYAGFVKERFERCLDLYLCPRAYTKRLNIDPESLVPKIPKARELRPYPNALARVMHAMPEDVPGLAKNRETADATLRPTGRHGDARLQAVAVSPGDGQWVAVACADGCVRIYEAATGRLSWVFECYSKLLNQSNEELAEREQRNAALADSAGEDGSGGTEALRRAEKLSDAARKAPPMAAVRALVWNPNPEHALLAAAAGTRVFVIALPMAGAASSEVTDALLQGAEGVQHPSSGKGDPEEGVDVGTGGDGAVGAGNTDEHAAEGEAQDGDDDGDAAMKHVRWLSIRPSRAGARAVEAAEAVAAEDKERTAQAADDDVEPHPLAVGLLARGRRVICGAHVRSPSGLACGVRLVLEVESSVAAMAWHRKGDYLATMAPACGASAVLVHQLSRGRSQQPFRKAQGRVTAMAFHPVKPFFFLANQQSVRVYHLVKQALVKDLHSNCKWISSLDVHPTGDHLLVGSFDKKVAWFDLDLGAHPFKMLRYHTRAVRAVRFHRTYPLFATCGDDGAIHVFHGRVYDDLMRNPLLVPLKILRAHEVTAGLGVLDIAWHPKQPWLFAVGGDGNVTLFQDI